MNIGKKMVAGQAGAKENIIESFFRTQLQQALLNNKKQGGGEKFLVFSR